MAQMKLGAPGRFTNTWKRNSRRRLRLPSQPSCNSSRASRKGAREAVSSSPCIIPPCRTSWGAGAGVMIGEVNLTCAIYLDDSMIPTPTVEATRGTLATLEDYGKCWSQQWAPAKCKVLCLNVLDPPAQWHTHHPPCQTSGLK
jgi:hypothetical protein